MKNSIGIIVVLLATLLAGVATAQTSTRVYFEDFNGTAGASWYANGFTARDNELVAVRTDNHAYGGTGYSLRGNLYDGETDGIDNTIYASGSTPIWGNFGGNIVADTPSASYVSWRTRLDAANWVPEYNGKIAYFRDANDDFRSAFISHGTDTYGFNTIRLVRNGDATNEWNDTWCTANWGNTGISFTTSTTGGPDGEWHEYGIYTDYTTNLMSIYFDGVICVPNNINAVGNAVPVPSGFRMAGMAYWHTTVSNVAASTDGPAGEYRLGWQIDDIAAWDGLPGDTPPPVENPSGITAAPTNLTVSGGN